MTVAYIISAIILLIGAGLITFILIRDKKNRGNNNQGDEKTQSVNNVEFISQETDKTNDLNNLDNNVVKTVYLNKDDNFSGTEFLPTPEKMSNDDFDFEFAGWDKNYVDENGNKVVKAIFIQKPKQMSLFDNSIQTNLETSADEVAIEENIENIEENVETLDEIQDVVDEVVEVNEVEENNLTQVEVQEESQEVVENNALEVENIEEITEEKDPFEGLVFETKETSDDNVDLEQLFDQVEKLADSLVTKDYSEIEGNGNPLENEFYQEPEIGEEEVIQEVKVNDDNKDFISTQNTSRNNFNEENSAQEKSKVTEPSISQESSQNNVKIENTEKLFNQIHLGRTNSSNFVGTTRSKNGFKIQMNENYQSYPTFSQSMSMSIDVDNKSSSTEIDDIFKRMGVNMPKTSSSQYSNNPQTNKNENFYNNVQYNSVMNGPFKSRKMELNRAKFEEMQAEMEKNQPKPVVENTSTEEFLSGVMLVNKKKISK